MCLDILDMRVSSWHRQLCKVQGMWSHILQTRELFLQLFLMRWLLAVCQSWHSFNSFPDRWHWPIHSCGLASVTSPGRRCGISLSNCKCGLLWSDRAVGRWRQGRSGERSRTSSTFTSHCYQRLGSRRKNLDSLIRHARKEQPHVEVNRGICMMRYIL